MSKFYPDRTKSTLGYLLKNSIIRSDETFLKQYSKKQTNSYYCLFLVVLLCFKALNKQRNLNFKKYFFKIPMEAHRGITFL